MASTNTNKKGGKAQKKSSSTKNKKKTNLGKNFILIYVIYQDHVEFRNCNSITMRPYIREIIGWKSFESHEAICICSDRPAKSLQDIQTKESGHLILKSGIIALLEINFDNCFICNREYILGNINP